MCSLLRMVAFIKQHSLVKRMVKDISQISEFSSVAWKFLFAIYKSSWNKLIANKNNKYFKQYMFLQFNKTPTRSITTNKLLKSKQANILRISWLIPSRPSKSVLTKLKFVTRINLWTWLLNPTTSHMHKPLKVISRKSSQSKISFWNYPLTRLWKFIMS